MHVDIPYMDGFFVRQIQLVKKNNHHFQAPQNNSPSDEENHGIFPHNFTHGEGAKGGSKKRRIFHGSGTQHAKSWILHISLDVTDKKGILQNHPPGAGGSLNFFLGTPDQFLPISWRFLWSDFPPSFSKKRCPCSCSISFRILRNRNKRNAFRIRSLFPLNPGGFQ